MLTGGAAIWLLHSSVWTSLLILGLPLWRHVDLLPIIDHTQDDEDAPPPAAVDAAEERAVADMLDRPSAQDPDAGQRP